MEPEKPTEPEKNAGLPDGLKAVLAVIGIIVLIFILKVYLKRIPIIPL